MRSSWSPSPEAWWALLRHLGAAVSRAELFAHMAAARTPGALAARLSEDLARIYEAEIGFVLTRAAPGERLRPLAAAGLAPAELSLLADADLLDELGPGRAAAAWDGDDLLSVRASSVAAAAAGCGGTAVLAGVARLERRSFDASAVALLEWVVRDAAQELDRLALEQRLHEAERLEAVGRLAAGVAHQFNNLLMAIAGYAELARDRIGDDDEHGVAAPLEQVRASAARAAELTRQLLAFSRQQPLRLELLRLNDVVQRAAETMQAVVGSSICIRTRLDPGCHRVRADVRQVENLVLQLAENARDAMPEGGTLELAVADVTLEEPLAADPEDVAPGRYVRLSVNDTGSGIVADAIPHIFEPFFTTKEQGRGVGLGLSSIYGIVRQSGGYMAVRSTLGVGTTFDVYLPAADEDATEEPAAAGTETVLLVEDDDAVRMLVCEFLTSSGYRVLQAADGRAALALEAQHPEERIDLLLTDIVMPGPDGREVARLMTDRRPGMPVVYMSGYSRDMTHDIGDALLVAKPFGIAEITEAVRAAIDGARSASARQDT